MTLKNENQCRACALKGITRFNCRVHGIGRTRKAADTGRSKAAKARKERHARAVQFFYENAGFSYDPKKETKEQGRQRCAEEMATAEEYAFAHDWTWEWESDLEGCVGCDCGSEDCPCSTGEAHETLCCRLMDAKGETLASLGGICGAGAEYKRVVRVELALEAMPR